VASADDYAEGWFYDPYKRHEARWFSNGTPTDLVRDGSQVAHDAPPDEPMPTPLSPWGDDSAVNQGSALRRADSAQDGRTPGRWEAAWKVARVMMNPGDTDVW
jgi:hypothetical protein